MHRPYHLMTPDRPAPPDRQLPQIFCAVGRFHSVAAVHAALAAGAHLAIVDAELHAQLGGFDPRVRCVADVRRTYARLAQLEVGRPARHLTAVAVTGTNGKSSVASWLWWVLQHTGHPAGLIGTVAVDTGARRQAGTLTTPDARHLAGYLDEMVRTGRTHVVLEASSHGLDQRRTDGMAIRTAVFTNFSADHLDYHGSLAAYFLAKQRLFAMLPAQSQAVLNADDPASPRLAAATRAQITWYGTKPLRAPGVWGRWDGDHAQVRIGSWTASGRLAGLGSHRLANALAVLAAAITLGETPERVWPALVKYPGLWRRLQVISPPGDPLLVLDDCAHNPANLRAALDAACRTTSANVHVVYAIRGNRGPAINAANAEVLAAYASHPIALTITAARDLAGPADQVSPSEQDVYFQALAATGHPWSFTATAREAFGQVACRAARHDTVLILGAHAMDHAAELWHRLARAREPAPARPLVARAHQPAALGAPDP